MFPQLSAGSERVSKRRVTDSLVATSQRDVFGGERFYRRKEESGELNSRQEMMKNTVADVKTLRLEEARLRNDKPWLRAVLIKKRARKFYAKT